MSRFHSACIALAVLATLANAAAVYEGFEYPPGTKLHNVGVAARGWAGSWVAVSDPDSHYASVQKPSDAYGYVLSQGGCAVGPDSSAFEVYRPIAPALTASAGSSIWICVVIAAADSTAAVDFGLIDSRYAFDIDGGNPMADRLFSVRISGTGSSRAFRLHKHHENDDWISPQSDDYGEGSVRWTPGPHIVLIRVDIGTQSSSAYVWLDPYDPFHLHQPQLWFEGNANRAVQIDGVVWKASDNHHNSNAVMLDEIRMGNTLAEVLPDTRDATANMRHGISHRTARVWGVVDGARYFGGEGHIDCGTLDGLREMTLTAWVWRQRLNDGEKFAAMHDGTSGWIAGFNSGYRARFANDAGSVHSPEAIESGAWHYIACVVDSTALRLYLDGDPVDELAAAPSATPADVPLQLGAWLQGQHFKGILDEVRISDVARSASWIKLSYETQKLGQKVTQVPLNDPVPPDVALGPLGDVLVAIQAPPSADRVEFERRDRAYGDVWLPVELDSAGPGVYTDPSALCEHEYEYRVRYRNGRTVTSWSTPVVVTTGRCLDRRKPFELATVVLDTFGEPVECAECAVVLRFYDALEGGNMLHMETLVTTLRHGWLRLTLGQRDALRSLVEQNDILAVQLEVDGLIVQDRLPVSAQGAGTLISPRRYVGTGDPTGRANSAVGSLFFDTQAQALYFKHGPNITDWKVVQ